MLKAISLGNAMPTPSAGAAGRPVGVNSTVGRERTPSLDPFELIREQAHEALNAIRSRCREDHIRILNCRGATGGISPPCADKRLTPAAKLPLKPRRPDAGWDAVTRIKISRAFARALAEARNEIAESNKCVDELFDGARQRAGNEAGSFAGAVEDEQPADDRSIAAGAHESQEGRWVTSPAEEQDIASVAAPDETLARELNWSAEVEETCFRPVDLYMPNPLIGQEDLNKVRQPIEIDPEDPIYHPDGLHEETHPFAGGRHLGRARRWAPRRWPMSRLQTAILVLLVVDSILVGWRPEIVDALPQTSSFYKLLGFSVNLRGLAFDDVVTTAEQREGVPILVVVGKIINHARSVADVPRLKFIVRDAAQHEIYSWTAVPSRTLLSPGQTVSFRTELASPPPETHDLLLRFVDHRDIVAAER